MGSDIDEEELAMALELSQLSPEGFDEQAAQLHHDKPPSTECVPHAAIPSGEDGPNVAPAPNVSPNASEERGAKPHPRGFTSAGGEDHKAALPSDSSDGELELLLALSQLPPDVFDEQLGGLNLQEDTSLSRPLEVRHHPWA